MTKEQLIALGLSEEQVTNILKLHTETINGDYVPKHRFDEINIELKNSKAQVTERDTQIKDLKKFEGDNQALQTKIGELETANKTIDTEYKNQIAVERKKNAVKLALLEDAEGRPHDADMVMGLFNLESIGVDEVTGKITSGFKDQHENIKKDKSFLFNVAKSENTNNSNPQGFKFAGKTPEDGQGSGGSVDTITSFGKSLAQAKLGMMGVTQTTQSTNN